MDRVIIIAEAGVNHNGSLKLAKKLVAVAAEAGADYVKFQTFKAENIVSKKAEKAKYQQQRTRKKESQLQMLERLELTEKDHRKLIEYCEKKSIKFLSTPFDLESIELLKKMGVTIGKVPSGEITNLPYLQKMASSFDELILSTGMSELDEVEAALKVLLDAGAKKEKITILHCTTEYPAPMEAVNLNAMITMQKKFGVRVGYSDHTKGIEVPIAAVALGAAIIEKHFTLSRRMKGPDHKASLEPDELKEMVISIHNIEKALGDGSKKPSLSEQKNLRVARKSIVAARNMSAGHILRKDDIAIKRPGSGISPMLIDEIIGKKLKTSVREDELFSFEHFEN